jgi:hypothetical protein
MARKTKSSSSSSSSRDAAAQATIDHEEIRRWVQERGGKPACVKGTERGDSCLLRIDFPGGAGAESLEEMSWDEFFKTFDESNLAFLYQDHKADGEPSTFNKLINRDEVEQKSGQSRSASSRHGRSSR